MTTRSSLQRGATQQQFVGPVRKWKLRWVDTGGSSGAPKKARIQLLKWVQTEERAELPSKGGLRLQNLVPLGKLKEMESSKQQTAARPAPMETESIQEKEKIAEPRADSTDVSTPKANDIKDKAEAAAMRAISAEDKSELCEPMEIELPAQPVSNGAQDHCELPRGRCLFVSTEVETADVKQNSTKNCATEDAEEKDIQADLEKDSSPENCAEAVGQEQGIEVVNAPAGSTGEGDRTGPAEFIIQENLGNDNSLETTQHSVDGAEQARLVPRLPECSAVEMSDGDNQLQSAPSGSATGLSGLNECSEIGQKQEYDATKKPDNEVFGFDPVKGRPLTNNSGGTTSEVTAGMEIAGAHWQAQTNSSREGISEDYCQPSTANEDGVTRTSDAETNHHGKVCQSTSLKNQLIGCTVQAEEAIQTAQLGPLDEMQMTLGPLSAGEGQTEIGFEPLVDDVTCQADIGSDSPTSEDEGSPPLDLASAEGQDLPEAMEENPSLETNSEPDSNHDGDLEQDTDSSAQRSPFHDPEHTPGETLERIMESESHDPQASFDSEQSQETASTPQQDGFFITEGLTEDPLQEMDCESSQEQTTPNEDKSEGATTEFQELQYQDDDSLGIEPSRNLYYDDEPEPENSSRESPDSQLQQNEDVSNPRLDVTQDGGVRNVQCLYDSQHIQPVRSPTGSDASGDCHGAVPVHSGVDVVAADGFQQTDDVFGIADDSKL